MSAQIKPGDLVMVVRPAVCCGRTDAIGKTGVVEQNPAWATYAQCDACGAISFEIGNLRTIEGGCYHVQTLKKIDPSAEGDSLPARRDLEVPA